MMKQVGKGGRGPMAGLANMFGLGGGFPGGGVPDLSKMQPPPGGLSPDAIAEAQKKLEQMQGSGGSGGAKLPGLPGLGKPGLPGLGGGGGLPGLGGFNPFGRKK
jgi:signal recognition particle subunit SRP54